MPSEMRDLLSSRRLCHAREGVFAIVIEPGEISVGDKIVLRHTEVPENTKAS